MILNKNDTVQTRRATQVRQELPSQFNPDIVLLLTQIRLTCHLNIKSDPGIDVREGTSGSSADVPRFGLRMHSVLSAIGS